MMGRRVGSSATWADLTGRRVGLTRGAAFSAKAGITRLRTK